MKEQVKALEAQIEMIEKAMKLEEQDYLDFHYQAARVNYVPRFLSPRYRGFKVNQTNEAGKLYDYFHQDQVKCLEQLRSVLQEVIASDIKKSYELKGYEIKDLSLLNIIGDYVLNYSSDLTRMQVSKDHIRSGKVLVDGKVVTDPCHIIEINEHHVITFNKMEILVCNGDSRNIVPFPYRKAGKPLANENQNLDLGALSARSLDNYAYTIQAHFDKKKKPVEDVFSYGIMPPYTFQYNGDNLTEKIQRFQKEKETEEKEYWAYLHQEPHGQVKYKGFSKSDSADAYNHHVKNRFAIDLKLHYYTSVQKYNDLVQFVLNALARGEYSLMKDYQPIYDTHAIIVDLAKKIQKLGK